MGEVYQITGGIRCAWWQSDRCLTANHSSRRWVWSSSSALLRSPRSKASNKMGLRVFRTSWAASRPLKEAERASRLQSGYVYHYAFAMLIGVAGIVTLYLIMAGG